MKIPSTHTKGYMILAFLYFYIISVCSAENPYWDKYGRETLRIKQVSTGQSLELNLVHYKGNRLFMETSVEGNNAEVSLLMNESMISKVKLEIPEMVKANELIFENKPFGAVTLLRPKVYPLIRFHKLPEAFSDLHTPIRTLIRSLIEIDELAEANDILNRIKLDEVDIKYSQLTIQLINAYLKKEDYTTMASIVNRLPVKDDYSVNVDYIIKISNVLRGSGNHLAVIPLYRKAEAHLTGRLQKQVRMWLAYSLIFSGETNEALNIISDLEEPEPNDELFSLYRLLEGSCQHYEKNYPKALDYLTSGFVRTETSYTWVPEMLYLIGDCYANSENIVAARNVWTELTILYSNSIWAENATKSLDKLPAEKPSTKETISTSVEASG